MQSAFNRLRNVQVVRDPPSFFPREAAFALRLHATRPDGRDFDGSRDLSEQPCQGRMRKFFRKVHPIGDGSGLENRRATMSRLGGSNPLLSASLHRLNLRREFCEQSTTRPEKGAHSMGVWSKQVVFKRTGLAEWQGSGFQIRLQGFDSSGLCHIPASSNGYDVALPVRGFRFNSGRWVHFFLEVV